MREIIFRGKRLDSGEWAEGNLVVKKDPFLEIDYCFILAQGKGDSFVTWHKVDPATVGQYTGLTDKNGKKIFEGDILSTHFDFNYPEVESRTVVEWGNFRWVTHQPGYEPDEITDFDKGLWTVIGNIHDNPELMEGERHG